MNKTLQYLVITIIAVLLGIVFFPHKTENPVPQQINPAALPSNGLTGGAPVIAKDTTPIPAATVGSATPQLATGSRDGEAVAPPAPVAGLVPLGADTDDVPVGAEVSGDSTIPTAMPQPAAPAPAAGQ